MRPALLALALALVACHRAPKAPLTTKVRDVADFHALDARGAIAVELHVGAARHVEVTAPANEIDQVGTRLEHGSLVITTPEPFDGDGAHVVITMPTLDAVALSGAGAVRATGISSPKLAIELRGAGSLELAGIADTVSYDTSGAGSVEARALTAKSAKVSLAGTGSLALTASDSVTITVSGVGSVDVFGHPRSVAKSVSGVGVVTLHE